MRVETAAEQLFFTTVYLIGTNAAGDSWRGTGFIINYEAGQDQGRPVLVTNKHVLADATQLTVRFVAAGEGELGGTGWTETTIIGFTSDAWIGHPVGEVDIAVMFLATVIEAQRNRGQTPLYRAFTPELMLTEAAAQELDAIEDVMFVGYPNGLYDNATGLPIARRGQTATPIQSNYQALPAFLIDASVFPGSSGSPVFIFNRGMYPTRAGGTIVGSRLHLVGVLAAVHTRSVFGDVHDLPAKSVAAFEDPIDLGIVYKASAIQECVNLLFERAGIDADSLNTPDEPLEGQGAERAGTNGA